MKQTLTLSTLFLLLTTAVIAATTDSGWPPPAAGSVRLEAKLEKTIFRVDVIALELWLGPLTTDEIRQLCPTVDLVAVPQDSLAAIVANSRDARAQMVLLRDVSLDRFLDGVTEDMRRAHEAGLLGAKGFQLVATGLPIWLAPLRADGLHKGDRFLYTITGDTLRTVVERRDGNVVIDQIDVGAEHRRALLGSLVAPSGAFADELLGQLPHRVCSP